MVIERNAVRAIVLTPELKVLLMRIRPPQGGDWFWITPGGGLEAGESDEAGLRRELKEELGLERFDVGPLVWRRQHTFDWGGARICQREQYRIVHVAEFEPRMTDAVEARSWIGFAGGRLTNWRWRARRSRRERWRTSSRDISYTVRPRTSPISRCWSTDGAIRRNDCLAR